MQVHRVQSWSLTGDRCVSARGHLKRAPTDFKKQDNSWIHTDGKFTFMQHRSAVVSSSKICGIPHGRSSGRRHGLIHVGEWSGTIWVTSGWESLPCGSTEDKTNAKILRENDPPSSDATHLGQIKRIYCTEQNMLKAQPSFWASFCSTSLQNKIFLRSWNNMLGQWKCLLVCWTHRTH